MTLAETVKLGPGAAGVGDLRCVADEAGVSEGDAF